MEICLVALINKRVLLDLYKGLLLNNITTCLYFSFHVSVTALYYTFILQITYSDLIRFLDRKGIFFRELHRASTYTAETKTASSYFMTVISSIILTTDRYYLKVKLLYSFWESVSIQEIPFFMGFITLQLGEIPVFLGCPDVDPMHSPKIGYSFCSQ